MAPPTEQQKSLKRTTYCNQRTKKDTLPRTNCRWTDAQLSIIMPLGNYYGGALPWQLNRCDVGFLIDEQGSTSALNRSGNVVEKEGTNDDYLLANNGDGNATPDPIQQGQVDNRGRRNWLPVRDLRSYSPCRRCVAGGLHTEVGWMLHEIRACLFLDSSNRGNENEDSTADSAMKM